MIRKNPNGTYTARVGQHGKAKTFKFRKDAAEYEENERRAHRRAKAGLPTDKGPITYAALAAMWEANYAPSDWQKVILAHSTKRWGKAMLQTIQPEQIGAWLNGLEKANGKPYSQVTKAQILNCMRRVLGAGVEWGYISSSPARRGAFKAPGRKRVREIRPFASWAEVEAVAEAIGSTGPMVRLVCATGLRSPSEWIDLTPADFDLKARVVQISGTKTSNAPRTVPLSKNAMAAIGDMVWPLDKTARIFTFPHKYATWFEDAWKPALAAAGLEYRTPYEMRHTFATLALQQGAPIEDVSKVMGHSNISITLDYYRKWTRPMMDRLVGFLDQIGEEDGRVNTDRVTG